MQTKLTLSLMAVLIMLNAACAKRHEAAAEKPQLLQGIHTQKIARTQTEASYEAVGTVKSKSSVVLSSKVMGTVTALRVSEGQHVKAGQVVIEIDNRLATTQMQKAQAGLRESQEAMAEVEKSISVAQSAKASAEANRRLAASTFARYQTLLDRKSVSPQEFDEIKTRLQIAEAEAERADRMLETTIAKKNQMLARKDQAFADVASSRINIGDARISSPINGVVISKQIETGATATPGTALLTIADDSHYRIEVAVDESQLNKVRLRQQTKVHIDALGASEITGTVSEIGPATDSSSRSYSVKIDLPYQQGLSTGLYGTARFPVGTKEMIVIPAKAVVQNGQLIGVFVVDEKGQARLRLIKTGKSFSEGVEVLSGLNDGEEIVVDDVSKVREGARVR